MREHWDTAQYFHTLNLRAWRQPSLELLAKSLDGSFFLVMPPTALCSCLLCLRCEGDWANNLWRHPYAMSFCLPAPLLGATDAAEPSVGHNQGLGPAAALSERKCKVWRRGDPLGSMYEVSTLNNNVSCNCAGLGAGDIKEVLCVCRAGATMQGTVYSLKRFTVVGVSSLTAWKRAKCNKRVIK